MSTTTYYAKTADEQLTEAQHVLDTHVTSSATGRCLACESLGPCYKRESAVVVFSRTLLLPRRQPGATRPELIGARLLAMGATAADHRVRRPEWRCRTDGEEWPCEGARKLLADAYPDREALVRHMAHLMAQAAEDLGIPAPATLYRRFLGWTRDRSESCRACGRSSHAVVPGLPSRLFPCDGLPALTPRND
jgi:hypothetical protein